MTPPHLDHLAKMINERGYLVVSCPHPEKYVIGDMVPNVFVMNIPTNTPAHILSETDYLDMNAQWPDEPNLFTAEESKRYKFYRVSLD